MVRAQAVPAKRQLLVKADQAISQEDMDQLIDCIRIEARHLPPGFAAALDLRGVWIADPYFYERIKNLQLTLIDLGAAKIGTLIDNYVMHILLGQAGQRTRANLIAKRFYDEREWQLYLEEEDEI